MLKAFAKHRQSASTMYVLSSTFNFLFRADHPKSTPLIVAGARFWDSRNEATIHTMSLEIPGVPGAVPGVSELYYEESLDLLLIALSSEETDNAYDDGAIGNSYIGWITNFKNKMLHPTVTLNGIYCLTDIQSEFKGEKIEGLCIERIENNTMIMHLISDNDNGESKLFKVKMAIPE